MLAITCTVKNVKLLEKKRRNCLPTGKEVQLGVYLPKNSKKKKKNQFTGTKEVKATEGTLICLLR
jgi:hypothetical protein